MTLIENENAVHLLFTAAVKIHSQTQNYLIPRYVT